MVREALRLGAMSDKRELLILGGGLVGMTLALAAAKKGIASHVVDRADPAALTAEGFDGRASAISTASWNLFKNIGIAPALEAQACPIASIAVTDGMKPGRIGAVDHVAGDALPRRRQRQRHADQPAAEDQEFALVRHRAEP